MTTSRRDIGTITLSPSGRIRVSTVHVFELTYTAGRRGLAQGGGIRIFFPGEHSWTYPQTSKINNPGGFVQAFADDGRVQVRARNIGRGYWNDLGRVVDVSSAQKLLKSASSAILVTVESGRLRPGGKIRIVYGAAWHGFGFGARTGHRTIQCRRNPNRFGVSVDTDGTGDYLELDKSPQVVLVPDSPDHLDVFVKSTGGRTAVAVRVDDRWHNPIANHPGRLELTAAGRRIRRSIKTNRKGVAKLDVDIPVRRPLRIKAVLGGKVCGSSGPIPPADALGGLKLYWGDLHVHTTYSDDNRWVTAMPATPVEVCRYARDVAALDFIAVTDHHNVHKKWTRRLARQGWDASHEAAAKMTRPGKFVAFAGMEYRCDRGDTCFIFLKPGRAPYCRPSVDSIEKAWRLYEGHEYLSIPHLHNDGGTRDHWKPRNDHHERLIEICSDHGRFEFVGNTPHFPRRMYPGCHNVQAILGTGRRLGVVASSDDHSGHPGDGPLTAVFAEKLRPEDIWEALRTRRCYGTTGARIVVDFRVDGEPMGSELRSPSARARKVRFRAWATAPVLAAEIIRNGQVIRGRYNLGLNVSLALSDKGSARRTDYYYARILQADGELAWSSPIWVTPARKPR